MSNNIILQAVWGNNYLGTRKFIEDLENNTPDAVIVNALPEWELGQVVDYEHKDHFVTEWDEVTTRLNIPTYVFFGSASPCISRAGHLPDGLKHTFPRDAIITHFPLYWGYNSYSPRNRSLVGDGEVTKLFMSLANMPHIHRCMSMDILAKKGILDHTDYSWHQLQPHWPFKYWDQKITTLDEGYAETLDSFQNQPVKFIERTALNIVIESTEHGTFYTEKTFQAIQWAKPFVIIGSPDDNLKLKEFGFKLWDEFFDYEGYSKVEPGNTEKLIDMITDDLVRIIDKYGDNPAAFREICQDRAYYNKKRLSEIVTQGLFVPESIVDVKEQFNLKFKDLQMNFNGIVDRYGE